MVRVRPDCLCTVLRIHLTLQRFAECAETAGEDPMLAAEYVAHFVSGMQGDKADPLFDGKWAKAIATCKHYDAYSLENFNNQAAAAAPAPVCSGPDCDRTHFNAIVSDQELAETYLPAFTRGCVAGGGTRSIMCSYNAGVKVRGPLSLCMPACLSGPRRT
jgi:beta-glucosidase-like glycosyl hydrolase